MSEEEEIINKNSGCRSHNGLRQPFAAFQYSVRIESTPYLPLNSCKSA